MQSQKLVYRNSSNQSYKSLSGEFGSHHCLIEVEFLSSEINSIIQVLAIINPASYIFIFDGNCEKSFFSEFLCYADLNYSRSTKSRYLCM